MLGAPQVGPLEEKASHHPHRGQGCWKSESEKPKILPREIQSRNQHPDLLVRLPKGRLDCKSALVWLYGFI